MRPRSLPALVLLGAAALAACGTHEENSGAAPRTRGPEGRLLIVGWDGAGFPLADRLMDRNRLPNLSALIRRGTRAELESTVIPISSAAWMAAATGKGPGETGVFSFFEPRPGSYALDLVSSRSNHAPPIWRLLTARGVPALIFGMPLTYPPEPLLGTMVCGMLAPRESDFAWPPGLAETLRAQGFEPDIEPWLEEKPYEREQVLRQVERRGDIALELLRESDWRLAWIVFKEIDVVAHMSYGLDFDASVGPAYEALDRELGRLVDAVGPETDVILMSDHGFGTYARGLNLHEWLIQEGLAARRADAGPVALPEGPLARRTPDEAAQRLEELDLERTRAYAYACEGNYGSLRLNLAGREPAGCVTPEQREATLVELETRLGAHPWVTRVWRAETLLPGPQRAALPDLLLETLPDVQLFAERGAPLSGEYPRPLPDHQLLGLLVAAGPSLRRSAPVERLRLIDLAPLALQLLGQPTTTEMQGEVPVALLVAPQPLRRLDEAELGASLVPPSSPGAPYTPAQLEALRARLRGLGYGD